MMRLKEATWGRRLLMAGVALGVTVAVVYIALVLFVAIALSTGDFG